MWLYFLYTIYDERMSLLLKIENTEVMGFEPAIRGMRNPKNSWEKSDSGRCLTHGPAHCSECAYIHSGCNGSETDLDTRYIIGPDDLKLMTTLRNAGTDHRKFMRMITVYVDITGPLYWWKEFKTYRAGRRFGDDEPNIIDEGYLEYDIEMNSCSTMHKIADKEFVLDDFSHEHLLTGEPIPGRIYSAMGMMVATVENLNLFRKLYLKTKDKKYWWQMIQLLPTSYNQKRTVMLNYEVLANMYKSRKDHKLDEWHEFCAWIETLPYAKELIIGE